MKLDSALTLVLTEPALTEPALIDPALIDYSTAERLDIRNINLVVTDILEVCSSTYATLIYYITTYTHFSRLCYGFFPTLTNYWFATFAVGTNKDYANTISTFINERIAVLFHIKPSFSFTGTCPHSYYSHVQSNQLISGHYFCSSQSHSHSSPSHPIKSGPVPTDT